MSTIYVDNILPYSGNSVFISGSVSSLTASFAETASFAPDYTLSSSFLNYTSSTNTRIGNLEAFSASLDATFATDAQLNTATSSLSSSVSSLSSSFLSYTASQNAINNTLATTGSNSFVGSQNVTGSINVSGSLVITDTITAQKLVVQTITSSVDFVTGSTKFGTIPSNTHQFTGSVTVSGSLAVNGVDYANLSSSLDTKILNTSSSIGLLSGSYLASSASFDTRVLNNSSSISLVDGNLQAASSSLSNRIASQEAFSSSLDATFATDAQLNNATSSLSGSIGALSGSFLEATASLGTSIYNLSSSFLVTSASLNGSVSALSSSFLATSASLSGSISALSGSFLSATSSLSGSIDALSGSFLATSASLSGSVSALSGSFLATSASLSGSVSALSSSFLASTASLSGSISNLSSSFLATSASLSGSVSALSGSFLATSASLSSSISALSGSFLSSTSSLSGSISDLSSSFLNATASLSSSIGALSGSFLSATSSLSGSISNLSSSFLSSTASISSSVGALSSSFLSYTSSNNAQVSLLNNFTSSQLVLNGTYALTSSLNSFTSSQLVLNGKYATTASNTFTGNQIIQGTLYNSNTTNATGFTSTAATYTDGGLRVAKDAYISGSTYIAGNLTVFGTSSITYVTASEFIGLEFINLNTDLPLSRYAGFNIGDSGSAVGITSSFWYDSQKDNWLVIYANVGAPTSSLAIKGPITYNNVGNEVGITPNFLTKGQAGLGSVNDHHITSSQISDDGTTVRIPNNLQVTGSLFAGNLTGSLNGSNLVDASVANTKLTNSSVTINGTSLSLGGTLTQAQTIAGAFSGSAQVNHDATTNYIANQHIDHTTVSVSAGSGLSGGGTIAATRTLTLDTGSVHFLDGVKKELNTEGVVSSSVQIDHNATTNYVANRHIDHTAVSISAGNGLSGGGDISSTRTISLDTTSATFTNGVKSKLNADGVVSSSAQIDHNATTNYSANRHIDHTAVSISAGSGLTGGGDISTTRTLSIATGGVTDAMLAGSISNGKLSNSTISGIALGSNLATLTIGTGLSGTSYNGSGAVTIANTGVTSVVAGTGISINQGTGAVTVTNTITNNNQLTNGSGFQTTSGTVAKVENTVGGTSAVDLVYGNMADNDQFRIRIGGTATNSGFVEIATADDGTEPIHVRQYTGVFGSLVRTATLLDGSGNTTFPGSVTAGGDVTAFSDASVKENIKTIENALDKVLALRGVTYNRIDTEDKSEKIGVIAQETREVVPQVVFEGEEGKLSVAYGNLGGLFIEAFKQQQVLIQSQQSQIDELKELVNQLINK